MFIDDFFKKNQRLLLKSVNSPFSRERVRRDLDIPNIDDEIAYITPSAYHVRRGENTYEYTGFIEPRFSNGVQKRINPLLELFHSFDMKVANKYAPSLNFGYDSYSSQPSAAAGKDALIEGSPSHTVNYGTSIYLAWGSKWSDGVPFKQMIAFDFTSIPDGSTFSAASMAVQILLDESNAGSNTRFFECRRNWTEASVTWTIWTGGNNWGTAGCSNTSTDYINTYLTDSLRGINDSGAKTIPFIAAGLTQLGTICGTQTNYGWVINTSGGITDAYLYASSDHTNASYRPLFSATYILPPNKNLFFYT